MFVHAAMIIALSLGAGTGGWNPAPAVHVSPAAQAEIALPPVGVACDPGAAVSTGDFMTAAACGRCPVEQPRCNRDRDCDSVCGGTT